MSSIMTAQQARSMSAYSRGSAVEAAAAVAGLIKANGQPMPPSSSYLKTQAEAERRSKLDRAWKHYIGDLHGHFRHEAGQPDVNVLTNRASTIVDTGVDFLCGKVVELEVLQNGTANDAAQAALDSCWGKENRRMVLMAKLAQNGGIFGHVFVKLLEPDGDNNKGNPVCRPVIQDPSQITVETDPQDCDAVTCYSIEWSEPAPEMLRELQVGRMQRIERVDPDDPYGDEMNNTAYDVDSDATWQITNWWRGPSATWQQEGEAIVWPHPWAPIVDWQNLPVANQHWGMSDIPTNILHLNSVLNLTLSNINQIAKHHSFPWMYAAGVGLGATLDMSPGKLLQLQSPEGKIGAVEAHGDLAGLMQFAGDIRSDMDEQTRVPGVATGRMRDVPRVTSGVAFQMMYGPLLSKNTHKQRTYGEGLAEVSLRMLSLCGYGDGTGMDGWEVCVHWPSPLPNDDQATSMLATAAKQIGMSDHFICSVLSVDYDEEMEHRKQEAQDQMVAAAHGQGMPSIGMGMMMPPFSTSAVPGQAPGQPAAEGAQASQGPQPGQAPPINHPAAVAARQGMKAMGAAMKRG